MQRNQLLFDLPRQTISPRKFSVINCLVGNDCILLAFSWLNNKPIKLPASEAEQYITLDYPFTEEWISKGYTNLHFRAIRFAPTFNDRKGLPITSRHLLH